MELALYRYGGHAREVAVQIGQPITFFVDDEYLTEETKPISEFDPIKYLIMVAVADSKDRFDMVQRLPKETQFFTFIHPTALIFDDNVQVGAGSFIGANTILTTNIKLGRHTILNRGNQICHDSEIGDYFSAMPGAIVSGNVTIGDCVYMGTNSAIKEKLSIHSLSTIGMNSCVIKHIKKTGVYVGVPAKKIK